MIATKLKAELKEFREREHLYNEKRFDLNELELKYRKIQDLIVDSCTSMKETIDFNRKIIL